MLAYGKISDIFDEYIRIGETTPESLKRFCKTVVEVFGSEYLRKPNADDIERLIAIGEERGFPVILGSIDCMHWRWKNCPTAWTGQYTGHCHEPTLILEAVASGDLFIWHAFFAMPSSHNDINVLDRSTVFSDLTQGRAPLARYSINRKNYSIGYYLADSIYPNWPTIAKPNLNLVVRKISIFQRNKSRLEKTWSMRLLFYKHDLQLFVVRYDCMTKEDLKSVMVACIIMNNMIVEDERDMYKAIEIGKYYAIEEVNALNNQPPTISHDNHNLLFDSFMNAHRRIPDKSSHFHLKEDLIEHLWVRYGLMD